MKIIGKKVYLSKFKNNHLSKEYIGWLNNKTITKFSSQRFINHTQKTCKIYMDSFKKSNNLFCAINTISDDKFIGTITAYISEKNKTADIGIMIGEISFWNTGVGSDAWATFCNYLFKKKKNKKNYSRHYQTK